jgi:Fic family protein
MARFVERLWNPADESGLSRKDRKPGRYRAYIPDELPAQLPALSVAAQFAAEEAVTALARADERIGLRGRYLSHLLIRSESISSSWIEGNRVTPKKLAIAEALNTGTRVALDVIANVRATEAAIAELAAPDRTITSADIENLQHVIEPSLTRGVRTEQNFVGGTGWSPLRAEFVPPPEDEVPPLVANLAAFITATEGNAVVRAAIAHAQFETIHPFIDGNGRTGRALIHTVLRRCDAVRNLLVPISTVFAGNANAYIAGLTDYRHEPPRLNEWIISFAEATVLAASNAVKLADQVDQLDAELIAQLVAHRAELGVNPATPRSDAVSLRILAHLAAEPVLTAERVSSTHSVSPAAAHRALTELAEAGILARTKDHKGKLTCYSSDRHLGLVALTERSNRVGGGDTKQVKPRVAPAAPALARGKDSP